MRGVHDLEALRQRCVIDDLTGCWRWGGAVCDGVPRIWLAGRVTTGPRAAVQLSGGRIERGQVAYHARCSTPDCVNPAHIRVGTKAQAGAHLAATGRLRGDPRRAAVNLRNGSTRSRRSEELRELILASPESGVALERRLGIAHSTISYVRQGKRWRQHVPGASVFSQKVGRAPA